MKRDDVLSARAGLAGRCALRHRDTEAGGAVAAQVRDRSRGSLAAASMRGDLDVAVNVVGPAVRSRIAGGPTLGAGLGVPDVELAGIDLFQ